MTRGAYVVCTYYLELYYIDNSFRVSDREWDSDH